MTSLTTYLLLGADIFAAVVFFIFWRMADTKLRLTSTKLELTQMRLDASQAQFEESSRRKTLELQAFRSLLSSYMNPDEVNALLVSLFPEVSGSVRPVG